MNESLISLRTVEQMSEATRKRWDKKRSRDGELFLRGPIPLVWLATASELRGKALAVGLVIWFVRGLTAKSSMTIKSSAWAKFNLSRFTIYRGLKELESAGLVTVERRRGRCPVVTIRSARRNDDRIELG